MRCREDFDTGFRPFAAEVYPAVGWAGQRLNVLASQLGVSTKVLTKTVEPFLLRSGLMVKTDGGLRQLTELGREHLASLATETVQNKS